MFPGNTCVRTGHVMNVDFLMYLKYISDKIFELHGLSEENLLSY